MCTTLALTGPATSALKPSCSQCHGVSIRSAWRANMLHRPRTAGGLAYMERLELASPLSSARRAGGGGRGHQHLLEADPQTSVRAVLGELDDLREAVDCLETYQAFNLPRRSW